MVSGAGMNNMIGALIEGLADEAPNDPYLETVGIDLLAASRSYATGKKEDLVLSFYLAIRSLLREYAFLQERLKKTESSKMLQATEFASLGKS